MRGFLVDTEIFLNKSGEQILFDREMGQLDFPCICCSKSWTEGLSWLYYLPSDSLTKLEHLASTSCGSAYRLSWLNTGHSSEKSAVIVSAISSIVIGRLQKANHCRNILVSARCFLSMFFKIRLYVTSRPSGSSASCLFISYRLAHFSNSASCNTTQRNLSRSAKIGHMVGRNKHTIPLHAPPILTIFLIE